MMIIVALRRLAWHGDAAATLSFLRVADDMVGTWHRSAEKASTSCWEAIKAAAAIGK